MSLTHEVHKIERPGKRRTCQRSLSIYAVPIHQKKIDVAPVILPLLKKLHLSCDTQEDNTTGAMAQKATNTKPSQNQGIIQKKIDEYLKKNKEIMPEEFKESLVLTDIEIEEVNKNTKAQWKCKEWYLHKVGFISASKSKEV